MKTIILIIAAVWLISAGFSAYIADQKNRDGLNWFLLGLAFGIFALFASMAIPKWDDEPIEDLRGRRGW